MRVRSLLCALSLVLVSAASMPRHAFAEGPAVTFSPAEWDFGTLAAGSRAFLTLRVTNKGDRQVTVSVLPTCDCLSTGPSRRVIPAGSESDFRFSFLAEEGERGAVNETYLVQTDLKGLDHFYFPVHGIVKAPASN
ncbi:MAG: DUF1573 domain-containing protein [Spirochaetia bacterium]